MGSLPENLLSSLRLENNNQDDLVGDVEEALTQAEQNLRSAQSGNPAVRITNDHLQRIRLINDGFRRWRSGMQETGIAPVSQTRRDNLVQTLSGIIRTAENVSAPLGDVQTTGTGIQPDLDKMFDDILKLHEMFPEARPARLAKIGANVQAGPSKRQSTRPHRTNLPNVAEHEHSTNVAQSRNTSSHGKQAETVAVARTDDDTIYARRFDRVISNGGTTVNGLWIREPITPELEANLPRLHFAEVEVNAGFVINGDIIGGDTVPRADGLGEADVSVKRKDTTHTGIKKRWSLFK